MPKAPSTGGKKIAGLPQRTAIILFVVVAVGVFLYMRSRSSNAAASQLSTASVPTTGTSATPTDAGGAGASGAATNDALATLLSSFVTNPPYYSYTGDTTTTTTYNYNPGSQPMETSPTAPTGTVTSPVYNPPPGAPGHIFDPRGPNPAQPIQYAYSSPQAPQSPGLSLPTFTYGKPGTTNVAV